MRIPLVLLAVGAMLVLPPAPAATAACPAPGSQSPTGFPSPTRIPGTVSFTGGGWGHGIGMSQHGAKGAADLGCNHRQILSGYYPNTSVRTRDVDAMSVGLVFGSDTRVSSSRLTNTGSANVVWRHDGAVVGRQRPGETVRVTMPANRRVRLAFGSRTTWTQPADGPPTVVAQLAPTRRLEIEGKHTYNRGELRLEVGRERANRFEHIVRVGMEDYLLGLTEVPYSWPTATLQAQAVAGRSYAQSTANSRGDCTCTIYDSVRSQVYSGAREQLETGSQWSNWRQAVQSTAGQVLQTASGGVATAFYSSSNGGVSQDLSEAWGSADVDYLRARNTARWENAASSGNSRHRWVDDLSARAVADEVGLEVLQRVRVSGETSRGRASRVTVHGYTANGASTTRTVSRDTALRSRFGLYSNYFDVRYTSGRTRRVAGDTRYGTAAHASRTGWPGGNRTVVLARGDDPADALAGVVLAGHHDAPLLLTKSNGLRYETRDEIRRLGATTVYMLGGTAALSNRVEAQLRSNGVTRVYRVQGGNRFATMAEIAERTAARSSRTAFIVRAHGSGNSWADALAVSGTAARRANRGRAAPVLGVGSTGIPDVTVDALRDRGITEAIIIGGTAVVSRAQQRALADLGLDVRRWAGDNRYLTSLQVARRNQGSGDDLLVVTGGNYPDGLAAGALAGHVDATLLLAPNVFRRDRAPWRDGQFPNLLRSLSDQHGRTSGVGGPAALDTRTLHAVSWYLTPGAGAAGGPARATAAATSAASAGDPTSGTPDVGGPEQAARLADDRS